MSTFFSYTNRLDGLVLQESISGVEGWRFACRPGHATDRCEKKEEKIEPVL